MWGSARSPELGRDDGCFGWKGLTSIGDGPDGGIKLYVPLCPNNVRYKLLQLSTCLLQITQSNTNGRGLVHTHLDDERTNFLRLRYPIVYCTLRFE